MKEFRDSIELVSGRASVLSTKLRAGPQRPMGGQGARQTAGGTPALQTPYAVSFAANTSTRIPATIRYTANGANPCFRTQAMNHATDA